MKNGWEDDSLYDCDSLKGYVRRSGFWKPWRAFSRGGGYRLLGRFWTRHGAMSCVERVVGGRR